MLGDGTCVRCLLPTHRQKNAELAIKCLPDWLDRRTLITCTTSVGGAHIRVGAFAILGTSYLPCRSEYETNDQSILVLIKAALTMHCKLPHLFEFDVSYIFE